MALSPEDKEFIAEIVAKTVKAAVEEKCACPHGIDYRTAQNLSAFAEWWEETKKEAAKGALKFVLRFFLWGGTAAAAVYTYLNMGQKPPAP